MAGWAGWLVGWLSGWRGSSGRRKGRDGIGDEKGAYVHLPSGSFYRRGGRVWGTIGGAFCGQISVDHADGFPASRGRVSTLPKNSGRNEPIGVIRAVCAVRMDCVELRSGASVGRARCASAGRGRGFVCQPLAKRALNRIGYRQKRAKGRGESTRNKRRLAGLVG